MSVKSTSTSLFLLAMTLSLGLLSSNPLRAAEPCIVITNLPAYGDTVGNLDGYVQNVNASSNYVAVFIYVAGAWYSKPNCASHLTPIQPDGSWSADITTSPSDKNATEVAAFLVPSTYALPCVNGQAALTIPADAKAVVYANRVNPSARQFDFSGYRWSVKSSGGGLAGPGPNYFSDSTNNVWVDAQGRLHLKITQSNGNWQCAEVISLRNFGYGQYRCTIQADVNALDANTVLGFFTWSNESAYNNREIDIELSRWNYAFGPSNVENYAVSPYAPPQLLRFSLPSTVTNSTHAFIWQSNSISFSSLNGEFDPSPPATNILKTWTCTAGIPPAGGEQVRFNLWLVQGNPPANSQPVEVIISDFRFAPLGPPPAALLSEPVGLPNGPVQFQVNAMTDWHYQVQASSNLSSWSPIGTILATNNSIPSFSVPISLQFSDTNTPSAGQKYYRVQTEP